MSGIVFTVLSLVLIMTFVVLPEVDAKPQSVRKCTYNCMKALFTCKRRNEGDCCYKYRDCSLSCGISAPPCAAKRGSWNKRYQVLHGYDDEEFYPYF